jgi:membrane protein
MTKRTFKMYWNVLKKTVSEFLNDRAMKLGAALSYYTVFSMAPLLIIIISIAGVFYGDDAVRGEIFGQIRGLVGEASAAQIQEILKNIRLSGDNVWGTILGVITLVFGASGVFAEIQDSINYIWALKAKPKRGLFKIVMNRLLSFSMIASVGFLLLVSLMINAFMEILLRRLERLFEDSAVWIMYGLNLIVVFAIITLLFSIIFRVLPDGKVAWKDTFVGAIFTAFLFMIGKAAIGLYLGNSDISTTYGAAGSIVIILLWVYYSAIILYFGAEFTKVYAYTFGRKIIANDYAVHIEKIEPEHEHDPGGPKAPKS